MMPSLRRTASSPIVRSSPYSSSSSSTAVRVRNNKRPSASETTGRRVLADIDWWRVTEGQCDPNVDDGDDTSFQQELIEDVPATFDADAEHPPSLLPWVVNTEGNITEVHPMGSILFSTLSLTCLT